MGFLLHFCLYVREVELHVERMFQALFPLVEYGEGLYWSICFNVVHSPGLLVVHFVLGFKPYFALVARGLKNVAMLWCAVQPEFRFRLQLSAVTADAKLLLLEK